MQYLFVSELVNVFYLFGNIMRSDFILFLKEGSRLKVDYDVSWDRGGFFRIAQNEPSRNNLGERDSSASVHGRRKHQTSRIESDYRKRFRVSYHIKVSNCLLLFYVVWAAFFSKLLVVAAIFLWINF